MKCLVTGSSGHLGEALVRRLGEQNHDVIGIDINESPFTTTINSIADRRAVRECICGVDVVLHTATLHKPHVATHRRQDFIDTNVTGTLILLEEAVAAGVASFVFTSTTSVYGRTMIPTDDAPAVWVTEELVPIPRNIYGVTKAAAEDLCELIHREHGINCIVLRTSRFFPEIDDNIVLRQSFTDANLKANEFLHRRADLEDVVTAHLQAVERADLLGFDRFIISASTPFRREEMDELRRNPKRVVARHFPQFEAVYAARGWRMYDDISRVYVNERACKLLGWQPKYDFAHVMDCLNDDRDPRSPLAIAVGAKGYHAAEFDEGPYPVR